MCALLNTQPLKSFDTGNKCEPVSVVDIMGRGSAALREINTRKGLGFDDWDIEFYTNMVCMYP